MTKSTNSDALVDAKDFAARKTPVKIDWTQPTACLLDQTPAQSMALAWKTTL